MASLETEECQGYVHVLVTSVARPAVSAARRVYKPRKNNNHSCHQMGDRPQRGGTTYLTASQHRNLKMWVYNEIINSSWGIT